MGHTIKIIDPEHYLPKNRILYKLNWESGGFFTKNHIKGSVLSALGNDKFDVAIVDHGRYIGKDLLKSIKLRCPKVISYNLDDPLGRRDRYSWITYLEALPFYDLVVVFRDVNLDEAYRAGAKKVIRLFMTADEIAHCPWTLTVDEYLKWKSEVLFIGTWFPERGPFMAKLVNMGLPITIYGSRWNKAKEWPLLSKVWKGMHINSWRDYAIAIQSAKICLGLLSKGNRDLSTHRSIEIPSLGGLLCAERTSEHLGLYKEGEEAVFWSDATECADICTFLLANHDKRDEISRRGRQRCILNGHFNEQAVSKILDELAEFS
jgi:spore maturation protein CgeB